MTTKISLAREDIDERPRWVLETIDDSGDLATFDPDGVALLISVNHTSRAATVFPVAWAEPLLDACGVRVRLWEKTGPDQWTAVIDR